MHSACTQAAVDPNEKHAKAIKAAAAKITEILANLDNDTGCEIDWCNIDLHAMTYLRADIGLRTRG